jgi:hypothetical protein
LNDIEEELYIESTKEKYHAKYQSIEIFSPWTDYNGFFCGILPHSAKAFDPLG